MCAPFVCVYIRVYSRVYIYVNVCVYVRVREKGDADSTSTYVNTYGRYIGIGTCIPGGVPFAGDVAVGFRYDTVDRTTRIFGIAALSLGKR